LSIHFPSLLYDKVYNPENGKKRSAARKTDLPEGENKKWEEVMTQMESQMELNLLFLKPGYSINDFAREIEVPVYQISKTLNSVRGLSFVDYLNQKRIQHCVDQFKKGEWLNLTLEAIALECGFSNRNSFTKAFQKFHGQSPSEYRLRLT
jgi:AraC-like DNA-binding protein